ncbi:hypothetical protein J6590_005517 [Homalodisca vitripennis]|nr:hypothetical protein J6590_005517 [Homalodisca vitripennis]
MTNRIAKFHWPKFTNNVIYIKKYLDNGHCFKLTGTSCESEGRGLLGELTVQRHSAPVKVSWRCAGLPADQFSPFVFIGVWKKVRELGGTIDRDSCRLFLQGIHRSWKSRKSYGF